jgi:hypothetical protein
MANKKIVSKKKAEGESSEEEPVLGEDSIIDPAIIEDTFTEEADEYNDTDFL